VTLVDLDITEIDGACHCGSVRFHVRLSDGLRNARRCSCSFCSMRGAVVVSAKLDGFDILSGADKLTEYHFNTKTARHFFCAVCGIYTHHQRRSDPNEYGINLACLSSLSPFDLKEVKVVDGVNHPSDKPDPHKQTVSGVLRFFPD
jgi:hypothetical protein